ncbi:MAG: ExbD/TolR family protein [Bacillota bacterium]
MRPMPAADHVSPIAQMNTTPLIDVLLVLLIMLIMTIPGQTHAVKFDLPSAPPTPLLQPNPLKNDLAITDSGALLWNGTPISRQVLREELEATQQMRPTPELHLRVEARARYGTVDEVLAIIKREHVEKVGFVGNAEYGSF